MDAATRRLVAAVKVPTTHSAIEGVAAGIVAAIERLLRESGIDAREIAFIAHSTTQATNALLEGDLARVGVVGLTDGPPWLSRRADALCRAAARLGERNSNPIFTFASARDESGVRACVDRLVAGEVEAIAASRSFGVDRPERESYVGRLRALAAGRCDQRSRRQHCLRPARADAHRRAQRGDSAEDGANRANDGGGGRARRDPRAANGDAQRRRRDGRTRDRAAPDFDAALRTGRGRRRCAALRAPRRGRLRRGRRHELGLLGDSRWPAADACRHASAGTARCCARSTFGRWASAAAACCASTGVASSTSVRAALTLPGCAYAAFVTPDALDGARVERIAPTPRDRADYAVLVTPDGKRIAATTTCAANALGLIPEGAFARGDSAAALRAFELLARDLGGDAKALAQRVLEIAAAKLRCDYRSADRRLRPRSAASRHRRRRRRSGCARFLTLPGRCRCPIASRATPK